MYPLIRNWFTTGLLAAVFLFNPVTAQAARDMDGEVEALHRQIQSLRIIHGLELTDEQIEALIPLVEEGIGLVEDMRAVHDANKKSSIAVLEQVRADLQSSGEVSEASKEALKESHKAAEKAARPVEWELRDLAEEIGELFDEDQKKKLRKAMAKHHRPGPGHGERHEQPPPPPREERGEVPEKLRKEMREHHTRHLMGILFSEEFLDALIGN